jgi:hypothetical protein
MPSISKWMIAYGLLLIACDLLDTLGILPIGLQGRTMISGWAVGLLMVAAALCAAQGRRSVRLTGLYVGLFMPLLLAGVFAWHAGTLWHALMPNDPMIAPWVFSGLAFLSLTMVGILAKLRPREGIASRGYAIPIPPTKPKSPEVKQNSHRSEAG